MVFSATFRIVLSRITTSRHSTSTPRIAQRRRWTSVSSITFSVQYRYDSVAILEHVLFRYASVALLFDRSLGEIGERLQVGERLATLDPPGPLASDRRAEAEFQQLVEGAVGVLEHTAEHAVDLVRRHCGQR